MQKIKLPNSILTFFLIMHFIFGFNFGFIDVLNKNIRRFCKLISLLVCIYTCVLFSASIFISQWDTETFVNLLSFIQYCGHITILYFAKYKVYNFLKDMRSIHDGFVHSKEHKIGLFACIFLACFFVINIISVAVAICTSGPIRCTFENVSFYVVFEIPITGLDTIVLVQVVSNLYTYYAVIYLVALAGREKTNFIRTQFLRVSEYCEKFGGHYENLVVMGLLIHLPQYLMLICQSIYNLKENVMWKFYLIQLLYSLYVFLQMCAPAAIVEAINKQMENLKYKLNTRLMEETDAEKHRELSSLLRYMEHNKLYNKAWRVIPTDINFVVALFGFTTTNIIVIIQFMHIY